MFKVSAKHAIIALAAIIAILLTAIGCQQVKTSELERAGEYVVIHPDFENKTAMTLYDEKAYYLGSDCKVTEFSRDGGAVVKEYPAPSYLPTNSPVFYPMADMAKDLGLECR